MPQYGPLRDAPNPLQRLAGRSVLAGAVLFGVTMGAFGTLPFLFGGMPATTIMWIGIVAFALTTTIMFVYERGRDLGAEERGDTVVPYMPWFHGAATEPEAEPAAETYAPPTNRPFSHLLARRTLAGSVVRGAVFGAGLALPLWTDRLLIATGATLVGAGLGAAAHARAATT